MKVTTNVTQKEEKNSGNKVSTKQDNKYANNKSNGGQVVLSLGASQAEAYKDKIYMFVCSWICSPTFEWFWQLDFDDSFGWSLDFCRWNTVSNYEAFSENEWVITDSHATNRGFIRRNALSLRLIVSWQFGCGWIRFPIDGKMISNKIPDHKSLRVR